MYTQVRRAHLISTFGPGSLLVTKNGVSAIICGPAIWLKSLESAKNLISIGTKGVLDTLTIYDSYLEKPLGIDKLISPPVVDDAISSPDNYWIVPAVRFPLFEYCPNHKCNKLHRRDRLDSNIANCNSCAKDSKKFKWKTIQVPLVLACKQGHLSDLAWGDWLHSSADSQCLFPDDLRYIPGIIATRPTIKCNSCNASKTLDTYGSDIKWSCNGSRPWLPGYEKEICDEKARVIERSSATVYYAKTISSLSIPPEGIDSPKLVRALRSVPELQTLREVYIENPSGGLLNSMVDRCSSQAINTTAEILDRHIKALQNQRSEPEDRSKELVALRQNRLRSLKDDDLPDLIVEYLNISKYKKSPSVGIFSGISLVSRLREIRVLTGFSRLDPNPNPQPIQYEQLWGYSEANKPEDNNKNWLAAYEVYGEGILFSISKTSFQRWNNKVQIWQEEEQQSNRSFLLKFPEMVLVHTLSHLVMKAIAPYAGYSLASIRERIYREKNDLAFLIYTSEGDSQGTLGGLVELGNPGNLENILEEAISSARWCTTDPVCIENGVDLGLYEKTTRPGACHHCLLVPETSCEVSNKFLDRASVIGLPDRGDNWLFD